MIRDALEENGPLKYFLEKEHDLTLHEALSESCTVEVDHGEYEDGARMRVALAMGDERKLVAVRDSLDEVEFMGFERINKNTPTFDDDSSCCYF